MRSDRRLVRGTVLSEDPRTERFVRELLDSLGFLRHRFYFKTAPSGRGDAGAWVRAQYPSEVNLLRRKGYQRSLTLIAVRDGDNRGHEATKRDFDLALSEVPYDRRGNAERIANLIPTWSVETWLLALLGITPIDETASRKTEFERRYRGKSESEAICEAAGAWEARANRIPAIASLVDSKIEMHRVGV